MADSRRTFIRHTIWGGLLSSLGYTLNPPQSEYRTKNFNPYDWQSIRDQFLLSGDRRFFNTASLGASPISVIDAYDQWSRKLESTSETGHGHVKDCRSSIASYFNCAPDEIAITRNTTEGINIVANGLDLQEGDEILLSTHEHVGGSVPWLNHSQRKGVVVRTVDLDLTGKNNIDLIFDALTDRTRVLSLSHVTCTTGMILPVKEIVSECRKRGVFTCIDGAQAPGMISVDLEDIDPDFYATSGHKWLFGPKGTGVLFINKNVIDHLKPTFAGAYTTDTYDLNRLAYSYRNVAEREEYGTRNTPLIMALKEAFEFQQKIGINKIEEHGRKLATSLRDQIQSIPGIEIVTPTDQAYSASMLSFRSNNKPYQNIQKHLHDDFKCRVRGIYENQLDAIRVSCAIYNSEEDIDYLAHSIRSILKH